MPVDNGMALDNRLMDSGTLDLLADDLTHALFLFGSEHAHAAARSLGGVHGSISASIVICASVNSAITG